MYWDLPYLVCPLNATLFLSILEQLLKFLSSIFNFHADAELEKDLSECIHFFGVQPNDSNKETKTRFCRPFLVDSTYDKKPNGDLEVSRDLQAAFEELFKQHAVDMTWHGHHHSYQRSCAVFKNECVEPNAGDRCLSQCTDF